MPLRFVFINEATVSIKKPIPMSIEVIYQSVPTQCDSTTSWQLMHLYSDLNTATRRDILIRNNYPHC